MKYQDTPIGEIPGIVSSLRATFRSGKTRPVAYRKQQLYQLALFAKENADALAECLRLDLGRPKQESIAVDIGVSLSRTLATAAQLDEWVAENDNIIKVKDWQQSWKPRVEKTPKGVALIISPWNYPIILTLQPLCGAIAAGCCAVIKPSEHSPNWSAFLAENLGKYLDPEAFRVILGGIPETTRTLELKWDHIFYTGNGRVGRIVAAAAAKHLTPLTLELGGKSPVIVDATADLNITAKRIMWAKVSNAGQICIAPDYVLAEKSIIPGLVEAIKAQVQAFFPNGAIGSDDIGRIVTKVQYERLKGLLAKTKGEVVSGGKWDDDKLKIEPTIVINVDKDDSLMQEELFGPILPIYAVENVDEAISFVSDRDHPLVVYAFSSDEHTKKQIIANTMSGGVWIGDCFQPVGVDELPFGGVGESGYGRQTLKYTYDVFVYERSIVDVPWEAENVLALRYPPFTQQALDYLTAGLNVPIPPVSGNVTAGAAN